MLKISEKLNLMFLVILAILSAAVIATPIDSKNNYSVEEQDPGEQIPNVNYNKDIEMDKPIYELQLAVWPEDDQLDTNQSVKPTDRPQIVPTFEEQEIAYPVGNSETYEPQHDEQSQSSINDIPNLYQSTTTMKPQPQNIPILHHPSVTTKIPVQHDEVLQTTWHQSASNAGSALQEIPVWIYPHNTVKPHHQSTESSQNDKPVPIFPAIHFDAATDIADQQDNDDVHNHSGVQNINLKPNPTKRPALPVEVVEQYQIVNPNGTTEYKLVLSNGMTNYKKIYNKLLANGKIVTVQEGYDSVPIPGDDPYSNDYQTQYYIADEFGHNVYRVEKHTRRPKLPSYLNYKQQGGTF